LINIGNATDFQLPSKAVDYLAAGKPVLNLSYVENDPFTDFFKGNPLVFNLKVENGKVTQSTIQSWIEWLELEKSSVNITEIEDRIEPFLVGNVANQYLALLT
ncbi:MAG: hypothetical protein H7246_20070, partial [Phycisphaerae bacterium]|nr:hypothetical protein [Saprospiraceae bacterium]